MARAYSTIANGGYRVRPIAVTKVTFPDGHSEMPFPERRIKVFSDGVTYEATKILKDNVLQGTGTAAQIGCPAAGKTGTTDDFTDAWFVGYTPKLATAVWVGHADSRESMPGAAGGVAAAPIWGAYMKQVKGSYCGDFRQPKNPFVSQPFFGKYSKTGVQGNAPSTSQYGYTAPAPTQSYGTGSTGTGGYDPSLYESQPQATPQAPAPQPATPPAATPPAQQNGGTQAPSGGTGN